MRAFPANDTIAAIATPTGSGGIGVVRVSGPAAFTILKRVWRGRVDPAKFETRKLYLGEIVSGLGTRDSGVGKSALSDPGSRIPNPGFIDKVLAVKMPAPRTYTGDDVVEISCHGSQPLLARVLEVCIAAGARVAGPGEFTRRAFLAGKMDLAQAEAVCDLISAQGERAARIAAMQLEGRLSHEVRTIAVAVADIRAQVEAAIDFPDEGIEGGVGLVSGISGALDSCRRLAKSYGSGRMIKDGVRIAIAGKPNAGKSSVLNRIVGHDRALVHHEPGTTRDVVEAEATIDGVRYIFSDTAGLRAEAGEVESLGIERSVAEIESADIALLVFDGSREFSEEDREVLRRASGRKTLCAVNKSDLSQRFDIEELEAEPVRISALTGEGFGELAKRLAWEALGAAPSAEGTVVVSARHKALLDEAAGALDGALAEMRASAPAEFAAQRLRAAHEALNGITGEAATEELLDRIFSKFCIGK